MKSSNSILITHVAIVLWNTIHLILMVMNQLDLFLTREEATHHQTQISSHLRFKNMNAHIMTVQHLLIIR